MEALIFDTSFLIDFQRERKRGRGRAHQFLESNPDAQAYLPMTAYGEYAEGFESLEDPAFVSIVESFEMIKIDRPVAVAYARVTRSLRQRGQMIGANDIWIAATAIHRDWPLVTGNIEHFSRVPGIRLASY